MKLTERLARLIDVKSLVTISLVAVLCVMTLGGRPTGEIFNSAVMLVLGFFFGKNTKQEDAAVSDDLPVEKGETDEI